MFRFIAAPSTWEAAKWLAWSLFLLLPGSLIVLGLWWFARTRAGRAFLWAFESEEYLSDASDLPDLERRMRVLEHAGGGPAFVTFNH